MIYAEVLTTIRVRLLQPWPYNETYENIRESSIRSAIQQVRNLIQDTRTMIITGDPKVKIIAVEDE